MVCSHLRVREELPRDADMLVPFTPPTSGGDALRTSRKDHSHDSRAELGGGPWVPFKLPVPSDSLVRFGSKVPTVSVMQASVGRNCDGRAFVSRMQTTRTGLANFEADTASSVNGILKPWAPKPPQSKAHAHAISSVSLVTSTHFKDHCIRPTYSAPRRTLK